MDIMSSDIMVQALTKNLTDQGLFIAGLVIILGSILAFYTIQMIKKRDKINDRLISIVSTLDNKVSVFAEVQTLSQQISLRNRDILQVQGESIIKLEIVSNQILNSLHTAISDLKEHAKLCLDNHYKLTESGWKRGLK
jgi:hypothetical protein